MKSFVLFPTYIQTVMLKRRLAVGDILYSLNYAKPTVIQSWLNGWTLPDASELSELARVLRVDPVELSVGWLIENSPELEGILQESILEPGGHHFPKSTDLALRAPKPRRSIVDTSFGEGDPRGST